MSDENKDQGTVQAGGPPDAEGKAQEQPEKLTRPVDFPEQTVVIPTPVNMSAEQQPPVPVYANGAVLVCCWELGDADLEAVKETGKLWLAFPGQRLPLHQVHGVKPFEEVVAGSKKEDDVPVRTQPCPQCAGVGKVRQRGQDKPVECKVCAGTGEELGVIPPPYDGITRYFLAKFPGNITLGEGLAFEFFEQGNMASWKHASNGKPWSVYKEADKFIDAKTKKEAQK